MRPGGVAIVLAALIAGCDGRATGPQYRGAPLAVVNGRMTADKDVSVVGDVRLAVAWFTSKGLAAQPDAVHTESIVYEAVFPAGVSFGLYDLPLVGTGTVEGPIGVRGAAIGLLMAYDDRNRNGALDTYRAGQVPVDSVLGTSLGKLGSMPDPNGFLIVLVTEPATAPTLQSGLNLVRMTGEAVSFQTQVPIHLDGALEWNVFMCEDLLVSANRIEACLEGLRPAPDAGAQDSGIADGGVDAGLAISVSGSVGLTNGSRNIDLTVLVGGISRPDASVEMNGVPLVYNAATGKFRLGTGAPAAAIVAGADNVLQITATDALPLTMGFFMPGDFSVVGPAFNATIPSNTPFTAAWTDSKDAGSYSVNVYRSNPFASVFERTNIASSPFTVPGVAYQGNATLAVQASSPSATGPNASFIYSYVNQSIPVTLQ